MGISLRIFLVNDDDSIQRLALSRYDRLLERDPKERLPQYAGERVRYALAVVDLVDREPVEILRIQYSYLSFDSEGRIDPAEGEREARLLLEIFPPEPIIRNPWDQAVWISLLTILFLFLLYTMIPELYSFLGFGT